MANESKSGSEGGRKGGRREREGLPPASVTPPSVVRATPAAMEWNVVDTEKERDAGRAGGRTL